MKKRLLSLMLVFCMVLSIFPIQINAEKTQAMAQNVAMLDTSANPQSLTEGNEENPTIMRTSKTSNPFTDVPRGEWYHDAVLYAYENGLFSGTSDTTFSPDDTMTRGMYVTVLGRMSGITPSVHAKSSFVDVAADAYYAPYVAWAVEKGIPKVSMKVNSTRRGWLHVKRWQCLSPVCLMPISITIPQQVSTRYRMILTKLQTMQRAQS